MWNDRVIIVLTQFPKHTQPDITTWYPIVLYGMLKYLDLLECKLEQCVMSLVFK